MSHVNDERLRRLKRRARTGREREYGGHSDCLLFLFSLLFFPLYKKPHPSDKVTLSNYSLYIPKTGNPTQNSQNVSNGNKNRVYSKKSIMRKSGAGWRYEVILFSCLGRREGYELFLLDYAFSFSSFFQTRIGILAGSSHVP